MGTTAITLYLLGAISNYLIYSQFTSNVFILFFDTVLWPVSAFLQIVGFLHHYFGIGR